MKKGLFFLLGILILLGISSKKSNPIKEQKEETRGIYISYIEISNHLKEKKEEESKEKIKEMIENVNNLSLNTIILQVRPSCDAIYPSSIFPISKYLTEEETYPYDVLEYFIEESHKKKIKLYAWINPYRVSTTNEKIKENSPVYSYQNTDILYEKEGIYLNPAREETTALILEGVKEVLNYKVDGILFDDYFYPSDEIDKKEYEDEKKENENLSLSEFHLSIVNEMIEKVHNLCKKKKIPFGVSPEGNIENNYEKNYADVKKWLSSNNYVDFMMPQLYYGFENGVKPFIPTSKEWSDLGKEEIPLYPVLAFYKVGKIDSYAKEGKEEWLANDNIIGKEIIHLRSLKNYQGFILYRYDSIFTESQFTNTSQKELKNLKKILKSPFYLL